MFQLLGQKISTVQQGKAGLRRAKGQEIDWLTSLAARNEVTIKDQ